MKVSVYHAFTLEFILAENLSYFISKSGIPLGSCQEQLRFTFCRFYSTLRTFIKSEKKLTSSRTAYAIEVQSCFST